MPGRPIHLSHIIGYIALGIAVSGFIIYVLYQARFLIAGPQITLTEEPATVQTDREITLTGSAQNITNITVNDRPIVTDETGNFSESIILENGYTIVSIKAEDRYGRATMIERPFVYVPKTLIP